MAALRKPDCCPKCQSTSVRHLKAPERWECSQCENVICSRPHRDKTKCRSCGAPRGSKPFKGSKNQCLDCYNGQMREWRETSEAWQRKKKDLVFLTKRQESVRRTIQRTPEAFLRYSLRMLTRIARYKHKKNDRRPHEVAIDDDHLLTIYAQQGGCCAITGLEMSHRLNEMRSISIDRIDSNLDYVPGNVQLVCQAVNHAKRDQSQGAAIEFFRQVAEVMSRPESCSVTPL